MGSVSTEKYCWRVGALEAYICEEVAEGCAAPVQAPSVLIAEPIPEVRARHHLPGALAAPAKWRSEMCEHY